MFVHRVAPMLPLVFMLFAEPAGAFLDPPYITPSNPSAGDAISVNIYGGQCDLVHDGVFPPVVTQQANVITILFTGIHEEDPEWCYYGVGTATYLVGTYPAGSYTLQVDRQYFNFAAVLVRETLGAIPFAVAGVGPTSPTPVSAPVLGIPGLSILLLALAGLAAWCLHSRQA